jgi:hypothetical protein
MSKEINANDKVDNARAKANRKLKSAGRSSCPVTRNGRHVGVEAHGKVQA